ncbi:hypothetical protein D3C79_814950 [compost metagenome]
MRGADEPSKPRAASKGDEGARAARQLAADLAKVPGVQVRFQRFEGLGHGPMLPVSLRWVTQRMSEPLH